MNQASEWELHPQFVQDAKTIGDLPLSRVLASKEAGFPWVMLVPRRKGVSEIIDLGAGDQTMLMTEIAMVSSALKTLTGCDKLNVAAIGNVVAQLHIHVVARWKNDAVWPKAVWSVAPPQAYAPGAHEKFSQDMRKALGL